MSGGHFDYHNHYIGEIAEQTNNIHTALVKKKDGEPEVDMWLPDITNDETLQHIRTIAQQLKVLDDVVHALDYLMEGDIGENTFLERVQAAYAQKSV